MSDEERINASIRMSRKLHNNMQLLASVTGKTITAIAVEGIKLRLRNLTDEESEALDTYLSQVSSAFGKNGRADG